MNARRISFGMIAPPGARASKFGNKKTEVDGVKFDSVKEAERWRQLCLLLKADRIRNLERQVTYRLEVAGVLICKYRADFVYDELIHGEWERVTEDVKGYATDLYRLKKKLMRAIHRIEVRET
jgi:hypothetical protein